MQALALAVGMSISGFCICGHQSRSHGADLACEKCSCSRHVRPMCSVVITMRLRSRGPPGFYRPIDVWNAAAPMKPVIDGMKEVGMFPDDDFKHIPLGATAIERIGKDEPEGLYVVITELGEQEEGA